MFARPATAKLRPNTGREYDVALVDWRRRTFQQSFEVALDGMVVVEFLGPSGCVVVGWTHKRPRPTTAPFGCSWNGAASY